MEATMTDPTADLGAAIRRARKAVGLTQAELGAFAGADRFAIAALERGQVTTQVKRLVAVLDAVGLELTVSPRSRRLASSGDSAPSDSGDPVPS
jgi:HTH-type transcriptional regulator/antitoxin HipB